jgi:hypothetical protein
VHARPGGEDLERADAARAGSRSRAAARRAGSPPPVRSPNRPWNSRGETACCAKRSAGAVAPEAVAISVRREERLRDVALAGVGQDHDDPLAPRDSGARRPGAPPTAPRRRRCRPARPRAGEQLQAVSIASSSETAITSSITSRLSTAARSRRRCPGCGAAPAAAGEHRRAAGLDRDDPQLRVALLQVLAHPGDRAAGADAGDEHVDPTVERRPDLRSGGAPVDLRVGRVGELVGQEHVLARAIARAASTASPIPPSDSVMSTRAPYSAAGPRARGSSPAAA